MDTDRKPWPKDCPWPEPTEFSFYYDEDFLPMDPDEETQELIEIKEYYEQEEDILSYAQFGQVAIKFFQKRRDKKYNLDGKHEDFESKVHPV